LPAITAAAVELKQQLVNDPGLHEILNGPRVKLMELFQPITDHPDRETIQLPKAQREAVFILWGKVSPLGLTHSPTAQPEAIAAIKQLTKSTEKRRRRTPQRKLTPITDKQTEALELIGRHKGNYAAAAKEAGISRQALSKRVEKATKKLAKLGVKADALKPKTQRLPIDDRGQETNGRGTDRRRKPLPRSKD